MEEMRLLLATLIEDGAPDYVIKKLETLIEKRAMRIFRNEEEIRRFITKRNENAIENKKKSDESHDLIMLMFILLLLGDDDEADEFRLSDMLINNSFAAKTMFQRPKQ